MLGQISTKGVIGNAKVHALILQSATIEDLLKTVTEESSWALATLGSLAIAASAKYASNDEKTGIGYSWFFFFLVASISLLFCYIKGRNDDVVVTTKKIKLNYSSRHPNDNINNNKTNNTNNESIDTPQNTSNTDDKDPEIELGVVDNPSNSDSNTEKQGLSNENSFVYFK